MPIPEPGSTPTLAMAAHPRCISLSRCAACMRLTHNPSPGLYHHCLLMRSSSAHLLPQSTAGSQLNLCTKGVQRGEGSPRCVSGTPESSVDFLLRASDFGDDEGGNDRPVHLSGPIIKPAPADFPSLCAHLWPHTDFPALIRLPLAASTRESSVTPYADAFITPLTWEARQEISGPRSSPVRTSEVCESIEIPEGRRGRS